MIILFYSLQHTDTTTVQNTYFVHFVTIDKCIYKRRMKTVDSE